MRSINYSWNEVHPFILEIELNFPNKQSKILDDSFVKLFDNFKFVVVVELSTFNWSDISNSFHPSQFQSFCIYLSNARIFFRLFLSRSDNISFWEHNKIDIIRDWGLTKKEYSLIIRFYFLCFLNNLTWIDFDECPSHYSQRELKHMCVI